MSKLSDKDRVLKEFMEEHFDFRALKKAGFYGRNIRKCDFYSQAQRVCQYFGYKTVFEYNTREIRGHLTFADPDCPAGIATARPLHVDESGDLKQEPFVTVIKPWTEH